MTNIAELHLLQPKISLEGASRLLDSLSRAHAEGQPLGSRAPQIEALSRSLASLLAELRNAFAILTDKLARSGISIREQQPSIDAVIVETERLLAIVRNMETTA